MKELKQIFKNKWETENGDYIYLDDFGNYSVKVNGWLEITNTFEKAVKILNSARYN